MVVVSICALIAQLAITFCATLDTFMVQSELMTLRMLCQKMRYDAISTGQEFSIRFDPITHSYCTDHHRYVLPSAVRFGVIDRALGPPSKADQPIISFVTFHNNTMRFFPDGTISSGIIYLVDRHKKTSYALTNGIGAVSYLRFYRYDRKRWIPLE